MGEIFYPPKGAPEPGGAQETASAETEAESASTSRSDAPPIPPAAPETEHETPIVEVKVPSFLTGRVFRQSIFTAVLLAAAGLAGWRFVVAPALDRQSAELAARLAESQRALRDVTARLQADQVQLNSDPGLETRLTELQKKVDAKTEELHALNEQAAKLAEANQSLEQENGTLSAENKSLSAAIGKLADRRTALNEGIDDLERRNGALAARNKRLAGEGRRLAARVDDKRGAVASIGTDLRRIVTDLEAERRRLIEVANAIEESRKAHIAGLTALADDYARIAARNYGESRARYTVLAQEVRKRLADIKRQAVQAANADFGTDISTRFAGPIETYVTAALLRGKSAAILHGQETAAAAESLRKLLAETGLTVSVTASDALNAEVNSIAFAGADNKRAAERLRDLARDKLGISADLVAADETLAGDFVVRLVGPHGTAPQPDANEPRVNKDGAPPETGQTPPKDERPDAG